MPGGRAYLSARTGYSFRDAYNQGVYQGDRYIYRTSSQNLSGVPPADQHPRGFTNVPSNVSRDRARGPHYSFQVDGTVTFAAAGRHQMKGGVQFDRVGIDALTGATGNVINLFWGQRFAGVQGPLRLLHRWQQRRGAQPGRHHSGQGHGEQRRPLPAGRVGARAPAHAARGAPHRERARAIAVERPLHSPHRHSFRLRG